MKLRTIVLVCALLCLSVQVYAQSNWPMINGCREQTAWAEEETELAPPFEAATIENAPGGEFVTCDDGLLMIGQPRRVHAYDLQSDTLLWSFEIDTVGGGIGCAPAFAGSLVLCGAQNGAGLHALRRETGEEVWMKPLGGLYTRNPIPDGDRVYIIKDSLYCLNVADGSTIWSFQISGQNTPAVDDSNVYARGYALNKFTGDMRWQAAFSGQLILSVDDQHVYVDQSSTTIAALRKSDGQVQWTYEVSDGLIPYYNGGTAAITDDYFCFTVYQTSEEHGVLYVLDKATGTYLWHRELDVEGIYPPSIANGIVYATTWYMRQLWGFDLATGDSLFFDNSTSHWYQPIFVDHTMYVLTSSSLTAFRNASTSVEVYEATEPPQSTLLSQNYPNPFNPETSIQYSVISDPTTHHSPLVTLKIYNLLGQEVRMMVNGIQGPGYYTVTWDGTDNSGSGLPSGVYFYQLKSGATFETKQMVLLK